MANTDKVSTNIFGANVPTSTGAPGSSHGVQNQLDPSGDVTTELSSAPPRTLPENVSGVADQSGLGHGHVEAAQRVGGVFGARVSMDTGASGDASKVNHAHHGTHVVNNAQTGV